MNTIVIFVSSLLATVFLIGLLMPLASRIKLLDLPKRHKQHDHAIPLVGGLAIYGGTVSVAVLWPRLNGLSPSFDQALLGVGGALVLIGAIDDRVGLPVKMRFAAQVGAVAFLTYGCDIVISGLGCLIGSKPVELYASAIPFTIFAVAGTINAMNFMDGLDGLAGALALAMLSFLAVIATIAGRTAELTAIMTLVGAVLAFTFFNARCFGRSAGRIFMGDSGSMFLGFSITVFFIVLSQGAEPAMTPVTALWLFAVPLFDAVSALLRRLLQGRSPFMADREHLHHLFLAAGFSVNATVIVIVSLQILFGLAGIIGLYAEIPENGMFYSLVALSILYYRVASHPNKMITLLKQVRAIGMRLIPPRELFVGGFLRDQDPLEVREWLKEWKLYPTIEIYRRSDRNGCEHYHAIVRSRSTRDARRVMEVLSNHGRRRLPLTIRPYVRRREVSREEAYWLFPRFSRLSERRGCSVKLAGEAG